MRKVYIKVCFNQQIDNNNSFILLGFCWVWIILIKVVDLKSDDVYKFYIVYGFEISFSCLFKGRDIVEFYLLICF